MGWFSNLFHPGAGYDAAQGKLDQYWNESKNALTPYINRGNTAGDSLAGSAEALLDPTKLRQSWLDSYQISPEATLAQRDANQQGLDAASSMGLLGSTPALQAIQGEDARIGLADKQNYLTDIMNKYMQGVGINQGLFAGGVDSANNLANLAGKMGDESANMAYGSKSAGNNLLMNILGKAGSVAMGALLGGPAGAAMGLFGGSGGNLPTSFGGAPSNQLDLPAPAQTM